MQRHAIVLDVITYCAAVGACEKGQLRQQALLIGEALQY